MRVWHYLYFPIEDTATDVARRLRAAGHGVEVHMSSAQWLVLVEDDLRDQEALESKAEELEQLAIAKHGEYDGWERETAAGKAISEQRKPIQAD